MRFANPEMLYFLALVPLLVLMFVVAERARRRRLAAMSTNDKRAMIMGAGFERRLVFLVFCLLGVACLVLAAARPQWGTKLETVTSRGIDIMLAVDVSDSMRAQDVSPDRMAKARQEVDKFLALLEGDRVGLIAFAGSAYAYCPLTNDYAAIRLFLNGLTPGVISDGGTDVGAAVGKAMETFARSKSNAQKVLVIFTDGEHHESDPLTVVREAAAMDIQVFTIGIGNSGTAGERIPMGTDDNGDPIYKLDQKGNLVISQLDEQTLEAIAKAGGGAYYRVSNAGTELVQIYRELQANEEEEFSNRRLQQMEDRYQLILALALICLTMAYSLGDRSFKRLRRTQGVKS